MPYQGSNAEWLNKQNVYDLLLMMHENMNECWHTMPCVLDLLGADTRGCSEETICKDCIADWLARERRNT